MLARAFAIDGLSKTSELETLYRLAGEMPPGGRVVEVGSWKGRSTVAIRLGLPASAQLWAVDTWRGDPDITALGLDPAAAHADFVRNTDDLNIEAIVADSVSAARRFEDGSLDWVFIDADHSYRAVLADIRAWAPKLKESALLSGHDYGRGGVTDAVRRCFGDVTVEHSVWYTRERPSLQPLVAGRIAARRLLRR
jgi:predicted O-methyltransferase YrrM